MRPVLLGVGIDPTGAEPVYIQLYSQIRMLILSRVLVPGARLPSSRMVAAELSVSRATVVAAYDQLAGEGYIAGRAGSGMYVTDLPDDTMDIVVPDAPLSSRTAPAAPGVTPAPAGALVAAAEETGWPPLLQPGEPDCRLFPAGAWARLLAHSWRRPTPRLLGQGAGEFGDPALRQALARHVAVWRGLSVSPEQIIVTAGAGEGIDLTVRTFVRAGDRVVTENPGYEPAWAMMADRGATVEACPVDREGLNPSALRQDWSGRTGLVMVTPSRQFPLGYTMPLSRRLALIEKARRLGCPILEDDYDSEFRYAGRPLAPLASLQAGFDLRDGLAGEETGRAEGGLVIYLGSFSKVFSSGLRLGYLVVPDLLVHRFRDTLRRVGPRASLAAQPALAEFMDSGAYARHLRRMRRVYAERQAVLLQALATRCGRWLQVEDVQPSGMHVVARLNPSSFRPLPAAGRPLSETSGHWLDQRVADACRHRGLGVRALSRYSRPPVVEEGLVIGFAASSPEEITRAVRLLVDVLMELS